MFDLHLSHAALALADLMFSVSCIIQSQPPLREFCGSGWLGCHVTEALVSLEWSLFSSVTTAKLFRECVTTDL